MNKFFLAGVKKNKPFIYLFLFCFIFQSTSYAQVPPSPIDPSMDPQAQTVKAEEAEQEAEAKEEEPKQVFEQKEMEESVDWISKSPISNDEEEAIDLPNLKSEQVVQGMLRRKLMKSLNQYKGIKVTGNMHLSARRSVRDQESGKSIIVRDTIYEVNINDKTRYFNVTFSMNRLGVNDGIKSIKEMGGDLSERYDFKPQRTRINNAFDIPAENYEKISIVVAEKPEVELEANVKPILIAKEEPKPEPEPVVERVVEPLIIGEPKPEPLIAQPVLEPLKIEEPKPLIVQPVLEPVIMEEPKPVEKPMVTEELTIATQPRIMTAPPIRISPEELKQKTPAVKKGIMSYFGDKLPEGATIEVVDSLDGLFIATVKNIPAGSFTVEGAESFELSIYENNDGEMKVLKSIVKDGKGRDLVEHQFYPNGAMKRFITNHYSDSGAKYTTTQFYSKEGKKTDALMRYMDRSGNARYGEDVKYGINGNVLSLKAFSSRFDENGNMTYTMGQTHINGRLMSLSGVDYGFGPNKIKSSFRIGYDYRNTGKPTTFQISKFHAPGGVGIHTLDKYAVTADGIKHDFRNYAEPQNSDFTSGTELMAGKTTNDLQLIINQEKLDSFKPRAGPKYNLTPEKPLSVLKDIADVVAVVPTPVAPVIDPLIEKRDEIQERVNKLEKGVNTIQVKAEIQVKDAEKKYGDSDVVISENHFNAMESFRKKLRYDLGINLALLNSAKSKLDTINNEIAARDSAPLALAKPILRPSGTSAEGMYSGLTDRHANIEARLNALISGRTIVMDLGEKGEVAADLSYDKETGLMSALMESYREAGFKFGVEGGADYSQLPGVNKGLFEDFNYEAGYGALSVREANRLVLRLIRAHADDIIKDGKIDRDAFKKKLIGDLANVNRPIDVLPPEPMPTLVDPVESQIDTIKENLNELDEKIVEYDQQIADLDKRVTAFKDEVTQAFSDFEAKLEGKTEISLERYSAIENYFLEKRNKLGELETKIAEEKAELMQEQNILKNEKYELEVKIATLKGEPIPALSVGLIEMMDPRSFVAIIPDFSKEIDVLLSDKNVVMKIGEEKVSVNPTELGVSYVRFISRSGSALPGVAKEDYNGVGSEEIMRNPYVMAQISSEGAALYFAMDKWNHYSPRQQRKIMMNIVQRLGADIVNNGTIDVEQLERKLRGATVTPAVSDYVRNLAKGEVEEQITGRSADLNVIEGEIKSLLAENGFKVDEKELSKAMQAVKDELSSASEKRINSRLPKEEIVTYPRPVTDYLMMDVMELSPISQVIDLLYKANVDVELRRKINDKLYSGERKFQEKVSEIVERYAEKAQGELSAEGLKQIEAKLKEKIGHLDEKITDYDKQIANLDKKIEAFKSEVADKFSEYQKRLDGKGTLTLEMYQEVETYFLQKRKELGLLETRVANEKEKLKKEQDGLKQDKSKLEAELATVKGEPIRPMLMMLEPMIDPRSFVLVLPDFSKEIDVLLSDKTVVMKIGDEKAKVNPKKLSESYVRFMQASGSKLPGVVKEDYKGVGEQEIMRNPYVMPSIAAEGAALYYAMDEWTHYSPRQQRKILFNIVQRLGGDIVSNGTIDVEQLQRKLRGAVITPAAPEFIREGAKKEIDSGINNVEDEIQKLLDENNIKIDQDKLTETLQSVSDGLSSWSQAEIDKKLPVSERVEYPKTGYIRMYKPSMSPTTYVSQVIQLLSAEERADEVVNALYELGRAFHIEVGEIIDEYSKKPKEKSIAPPSLAEVLKAKLTETLGPEPGDEKMAAVEGLAKKLGEINKDIILNPLDGTPLSYDIKKFRIRGKNVDFEIEITSGPMAGTTQNGRMRTNSNGDYQLNRVRTQFEGRTIDQRNYSYYSNGNLRRVNRRYEAQEEGVEGLNKYSERTQYDSQGRVMRRSFLKRDSNNKLVLKRAEVFRNGQLRSSAKTEFENGRRKSYVNNRYDGNGDISRGYHVEYYTSGNRRGRPKTATQYRPNRRDPNKTDIRVVSYNSRGRRSATRSTVASPIMDVLTDRGLLL